MPSFSKLAFQQQNFTFTVDVPAGLKNSAHATDPAQEEKAGITVLIAIIVAFVVAGLAVLVVMYGPRPWRSQKRIGNTEGEGQSQAPVPAAPSAPSRWETLLSAACPVASPAARPAVRPLAAGPLAAGHRYVAFEGPGVGFENGEYPPPPYVEVPPPVYKRNGTPTPPYSA